MGTIMFVIAIATIWGYGIYSEYIERNKNDKNLFI